MKKTYKGFEFRAAVTVAAYKTCEYLKLPQVVVVWSSEVPTAAMSDKGKLYLADIRDDAVVSLKVLQKYMGYVIHELLHRKYTDFSVYTFDQYLSTLHNAVEDIWIEREGIKAGLTGNIAEVLSVLIGDMVDESLASVTDWADPGQYPFALAVWGRRYAVVKVPVAEGLESVFDQASNMIDNCQNSRDTMKVAEWVYAQMKALPQGKQKQAGERGQEGQQGQPGDKAGNEQGKGKQAGNEAGNEQAGNEAGQPGGQPGAGKAGKAGKATSPVDAKGNMSCEPVCVEPGIDSPAGAAGSGSYSEQSSMISGYDRSYSNPYTTRKIEQVNAARIKFEVRKLFEQSAMDEFQNGKKSGSINVRKLPYLATSNGRVFKRRLEDDGIDSAVVIVLDVSSSMEDVDRVTQKLPIDCACSAVLTLLDVLKSAGVSTAVLAFGAKSEVLKDWSTPMAAAKAKVATANPRGSTNDYFAVRYAHQMLLGRNEARKVCFVITDGDGDRVKTLKQVKSGEALGITTVGVGIGKDITHVFPQSIRINDITELGTASLKQVKLAA